MYLSVDLLCGLGHGDGVHELFQGGDGGQGRGRAAGVLVVGLFEGLPLFKDALGVEDTHTPNITIHYMYVCMYVLRKYDS